MRKTISLTFFLFMLSLSLSAQQGKFYAIDGSEWVSEEDRDAREEILWDEISLHLDYIRKRKLPEAELAGTYSQMTPLFKEIFALCRELNTSLKKAIEDNGRELELIKPKLKLNTARASNNEIFFEEDLRSLFDVSLDQLNLISEYAKDIVNYDLGELSKRPTVDLDRFVKNASEMDILGKRSSQTAQILQDVVDEEKAKLATTKKSSTANKKGLYYAFDGREYKTVRGRDNYEQRLIEKYNKIFELMDNEPLDDNGENIKILIYSNIDLLKTYRDMNEKFGATLSEEVINRIKKDIPQIDLTPRAARNKEICYLKEIYDIYDPLLGIFEIYTSVLEVFEEAYKKNIKARSKNKDTTEILVSLNINEQKDSRGNTHKELMNAVSDSSDRLIALLSKMTAPS